MQHIWINEHQAVGRLKSWLVSSGSWDDRSVGKQLKKSRCRLESAESIFARSASDDSSPDNELIKRRSFSCAWKRDAVPCPRRPAPSSE